MRPPELEDARYRLTELVGHGAVAKVWKAVDHESGDVVAVKVVNASAMNRKNVLRFVQEIEILTDLDHPNIVQVFGAGLCADGDRPYVVMEYVQGVNLRTRMSMAANFHVPYVVKVVCQVCAALEHAHGWGVVHRDLKPENVMVVSGEDPHCKILDFGMAKILRTGAPNMTTKQGIFGTPLYMAPERARGKTVTPVTDVYSVGLMAYEMLAGRRAFEADSSYDIMMGHVYNPVPPLPERFSAFWPAVSAALEKEPRDRPDAPTFARLFVEAASE